MAIISTLLSLGISGITPKPPDLGLKISLTGISKTFISLIRKDEMRYHITTEQDYIIITADTPGIPKNEIFIYPTENSVKITATYKERSYKKKLHLKVRINPHNVKKQYRNGVIELKYKRVHPTTNICTTL